ncbi:hypothetical protein [Methylosinus sp. Sm6]|uniref:hypothetical protein n=1 Tax=Methylosinus sp. Sm6 TaxID=2866948 RepID=UPI001C9A22A8|nr:hypothetical protein [Methylosinus sp. Sm6]MBY6243972.1 hypothetical protein [Methylosinus sp. Sm6]
MLPLDFHRSILPRIAAPLLAGLLIAASHGPRAEERLSRVIGSSPMRDTHGVYILPGHDGYALVECLTLKKGCGKAVADSWCEAHGHGPAQAFGRADDITGSVGAASASIDADAAIVTCGE